MRFGCKYLSGRMAEITVDGKLRNIDVTMACYSWILKLAVQNYASRGRVDFPRDF
jgi:hypothetical protein